MNIDHDLNDCVTDPKRYIKPYIPRRVLEDIDTQVSVSVPAMHDLSLPKISSFVTKKDMRSKCKQLGIHKGVERFTPPSADSWPIYVAVLLLVGMILK